MLQETILLWQKWLLQSWKMTKRQKEASISKDLKLDGTKHICHYFWRATLFNASALSCEDFSSQKWRYLLTAVKRLCKLWFYRIKKYIRSCKGMVCWLLFDGWMGAVCFSWMCLRWDYIIIRYAQRMMWQWWRGLDGNVSFLQKNSFSCMCNVAENGFLLPYCQIWKLKVCLIL